MEKNIWRCSMEDGLTEIMLGSIMVSAARNLLSPIYFWIGSLLGQIIFFSLIMFLALGLSFVRKRGVYPRAGIELQTDESKKIAKDIFFFMIVVAALPAVALVVMYGYLPDTLYKWNPLFVVIILIVVFSYIYFKTGIKRYLAFAALSLISGVIFYIADYGEANIELDRIYFFLISVFFLIFGIVLFTRFRTSPKPADEKQN